MTDRKPNFILVPDAETEAPTRQRKAVSLADRLKSLTAVVRDVLPHGGTAPGEAEPAGGVATPTRPRLIFGFDATASREPAWAIARQLTDALVKALPDRLDVALAVHGGSRLHTFTEFTSDARTLRDRAAGILCEAGHTRLLPILAAGLKRPGVRVVTYIGDVFEESLTEGRRLADALGRQSTKLIVFHDVSDWTARRDAEIFLDLARRTGGCVLPFDALAPDRLRDLLKAVAAYAVGGTAMLEAKRNDLPGAELLLEHLRRH